MPTVRTTTSTTMRLDLLEARALDLVDEDQCRRATSPLSSKRDRHAQDALVVLGGAHRIAHRRAVGLADFLDRFEDDVGGFVGERTVGAQRSVLRLERLHELGRGRDLLHVGREEGDVVAFGRTAGGFDVVLRLELSVGADHPHVQADIGQLLRDQRGLRRPHAGVDRCRRPSAPCREWRGNPCRRRGPDSAALARPCALARFSTSSAAPLAGRWCRRRRSAIFFAFSSWTANIAPAGPCASSRAHTRLVLFEPAVGDLGVGAAGTDQHDVGLSAEPPRPGCR